MKQLIFGLCILSMLSCRKHFDNSNEIDKIVLPNYTETGANAFGFMLNNTIWTVFGKHYLTTGFGSGFIDNKLEVSTFFTGVNQLTVVGGGRMTIVKNDSAIIDISAGFSFIPTTPFIKDYFLTATYPGNFVINDKVKNKYYKVDPSRPFVLRINKFEKIDSLNRICSGRFFGILYNEVDKNDSIIVSDGRLDTKIIYK